MMRSKSHGSSARLLGNYRWFSLPDSGLSIGIDCIFGGDRRRTLIVEAFLAMAQVRVTHESIAVADAIILLAVVLLAIAAFTDGFFQDSFLLESCLDCLF